MIEPLLNIYTALTICFMYLQIIVFINTIDKLSDDNFYHYQHSHAVKTNTSSLLTLTLIGKEHYLNNITAKTNTLCIIFLAKEGEQLSMHTRIKLFNLNLS